MYSAANQRKITVKRDFPKERQAYLKISNDNLMNAMSSLNTNAFKLFLYLAANKDGYPLWFSSSDAIAVTGMSASTLTRAWQELVDKGFLVEDKNNVFTFFEKGVEA